MSDLRTGLLGGTFDPIHCGHLELADAARQYLSLDRVLFVPAHAPPHRSAPSASGFHRFAMVALALSERDRCLASDLELREAPPSYTIVTLRRLRALGLDRRQLFFITGADAFADVTHWFEYPAVLDLAHFVVVSRPGHPAEGLRRSLPDLADRMCTVEPPTHDTVVRRNDAAAVANPAILLIDAPTPAVSATEIRQRCSHGQSIAGMTPPAVEAFIHHHGLYDPRISAPELHERS